MELLQNEIQATAALPGIRAATNADVDDIMSDQGLGMEFTVTGHELFQLMMYWIRSGVELTLGSCRQETARLGQHQGTAGTVCLAGSQPDGV